MKRVLVLRFPAPHHGNDDRLRFPVVIDEMLEMDRFRFTELHVPPKLSVFC
ncbi:MAG: hypothetical protein WD708_09150 [Kiritimatiellia bacterium]